MKGFETNKSQITEKELFDNANPAERFFKLPIPPPRPLQHSPTIAMYKPSNCNIPRHNQLQQQEGSAMMHDNLYFNTENNANNSTIVETLPSLHSIFQQLEESFLNDNSHVVKGVSTGSRVVMDTCRNSAKCESVGTFKEKLPSIRYLFQDLGKKNPFHSQLPMMMTPPQQSVEYSNMLPHRTILLHVSNVPSIHTPPTISSTTILPYHTTIPTRHSPESVNLPNQFNPCSTNPSITPSSKQQETTTIRENQQHDNTLLPSKQDYRIKKPSKTDVSNPSNTGQWTAEEHKQFLFGLSQVGENYKLISKLYVKTRSRRQIVNHAHKYLQKRTVK